MHNVCVPVFVMLEMLSIVFSIADISELLPAERERDNYY